MLSDMRCVLSQSMSERKESCMTYFVLVASNLWDRRNLIQEKMCRRHYSGVHYIWSTENMSYTQDFIFPCSDIKPAGVRMIDLKKQCK